MPDLLVLLLLGIVAGLIASAVMEAFQALAAKPFGLGKSDDDPSTVKFADKAKVAATGVPVRQWRQEAGRLVHYLTGVALGIVYVIVAAHWPSATLGFGIAYGIVVAIMLDYVVVPVLGLGSAAWETPFKTHAYGLSAHAVFGAALEGVRLVGLQLL